MLLVDDEALILNLLDLALTEAGFAVVTASNAKAAIAKLDDPKTPLAGIITDIRMGDGEDGWDVARHARELEPAFPVVYMTGDSAQDWSAYGVPNSAIVPKPFVVAQIITAISTLLNSAAENTQG